MTDDLVSVRGLVDSGYEEPLRQFSGIFDGYDRVPAEGYEGWRVNLKFRDLDNVTTAPGFVYNFPTAVINLALSNKHRSKWGYFGDSLAAFLPPDEDIRDCMGRTMLLVHCDGQDGRPAPKPIWNKDADPSEFPGKMVPTSVWVVLEVEGMSASGQGDTGDATEWAEQNLVGKTRAEFNKWAFADPRVRKDVALQRSIQDKSFIDALKQIGRVVEDENGVFVAPEM